MSILASLFANHIQSLSTRYEAILSSAAEDGESIEGIVFRAGNEIYCHSVDQPVPFKPVFHPNIKDLQARQLTRHLLAEFQASWGKLNCAMLLSYGVYVSWVFGVF